MVAPFLQIELRVKNNWFGRIKYYSYFYVVIYLPPFLGYVGSNVRHFVHSEEKEDLFLRDQPVEDKFLDVGVAHVNSDVVLEIQMDVDGTANGLFAGDA